MRDIRVNTFCYESGFLSLFDPVKNRASSRKEEINQVSRFLPEVEINQVSRFLPEVEINQVSRFLPEGGNENSPG